VKILVVDDHALVREGLHQVLQGLDDAVQVLQASTCTQAFEMVRDHHDLDLILLDYHLPDMTGLEALRVLGLRHPELPVLMISGVANVPVMQEVMQAGACGFITKSGRSEVLLQAIRQVLDGDVYVSPELQTRSDAPAAGSRTGRAALTHRQELVLQELLDGRSNREISASLHISDETVKTHVTAILRHFDVLNRTQAVVAAAREGYRPLSQTPP